MNNTNEALQFGLDLDIVDADGAHYRASITSGKSVNDYVFSLEPKERSWIVITVGKPTHREESYSSRYETLELLEIEQDGRNTTIKALVR